CKPRAHAMGVLDGKFNTKGRSTTAKETGAFWNLWLMSFVLGSTMKVMSREGAASAAGSTGENQRSEDVSASLRASSAAKAYTSVKASGGIPRGPRSPS